MEDGILKRGLLSLKKIDMGDFANKQFRTTIIYKHYILCFKLDDEGDDCVVIDTQKRTIRSASTGLNLGGRTGYSICHWKDNIFVIFGGYIQPKVTGIQSGMFGATPAKVKPDCAELLHVIEEDSRITFKVTADVKNKNLYWNTNHTSQIYKDKMYILGGSEPRDPNSFDVWVFDLLLSEGLWAKCQKCEIKSPNGAPRQRTGSVSVLLNDKIYVFSGYQKVAGGGMFGSSKPVNDLFALDLENMQWVKIQEDKFLPTPVMEGVKADVVGQKIYIGSTSWKEFFIYDPVKNNLQESEGVSPSQNFTIKSYQDRSILFRTPSSFAGKEKDVEFQDFSVEGQIPAQENKASFLVQSRKNILSQPLHMNLLWKDKPFSDVTFVVEGEEIQAHRIILLKCHYFQNMFNSGMMEANSNKINVPDISPTNFKAILEYIYFGKITLTEPLALDLIVLADMYCMAELKADCETYLSANLKIANLLKVIKASETADSQKLEESIVSFLIENIEKLQQEMDFHEIPHELLVKSMMSMKQKTSPSNPTNVQKGRPESGLVQKGGFF